VGGVNLYMKYILFSCKMSVVFVVVQVTVVVVIFSFYCCHRHPVLTKTGMGKKNLINPPPPHPSIKYDHSFSSSVFVLCTQMDGVI